MTLNEVPLEPQWQGAEAKVAIVDWFGGKAVLKQRFRKTYRHPALDQKLLTKRITQEVRCLVKAFRASVKCPAVLCVDAQNGFIVMEHIDGLTAKEAIITKKHPLKEISSKIGELIAACHVSDLIHGDLTTSNILFRDGEAVLIDFGLAQVSSMIEDKAVDLYVLERAISSTHPEASELFSQILISYADNMDISSSKAILNKLAEVQLRGRKRSMVG